MTPAYSIFTLEDAEVRARGNRQVFRGYAAVWDSLSEDLGGFREMVARNAFTPALEAADIRFLIDHNPLLLLGRTSAGTLRLRQDGRGLLAEADLPDTTYARDLAVLIERGDARSMSFRFGKAKDSWASTRDHQRIRTIHTVERLPEVSAVVSPPAYEATTAALESRLLEAALDGSEMDAETRALATEKLQATLASLRQEDAPSPDPRRLRLEARERDARFRLGLR